MARTIDELRSTIPEKIEYIVNPHLLSGGDLMLLQGDTDTGKTWLCQQIAFEISSGRRLLGLFPVQRSRVIYLDLEERGPELVKRFMREDWAKEYPEVSGDWLIYHNESEIMIDSKVGLDALTQMIFKYNPRVIIMDSFAVAQTNESDQVCLKKAMKGIKTLARKYKVAFIMVQHAIKPITAYDQKKSSFVQTRMTLDRSRGTSFLGYSIDSGIALEKDGQYNRKISFTKHSFSKIPFKDLESFKFEHDPDKPIPYYSKYRDVMNLVDIGVNTLSKLENILGIGSRHTTLDMIDELVKYQLLSKIVGRGRGNETIIEPLWMAFND